MHNNLNGFEKEIAARKIDAANMELVLWRAMLEIIKNHYTAAVEIKVAGITLGACNNAALLPVIHNNIEEIEAFLTGKPNNWE